MAHRLTHPSTLLPPISPPPLLPPHATGQQPSGIAQRLAHLAFSHSLDRDMETPYSLGASEAFDMVYSGGKADDITVLCALLQ